MNEDFVTYELAVKLKKKGFDRPCIYAYCEQGGWNRYKQVHEPITHILRTDGNPFGSFYRGKNWNVKYETNKNKIRCSAPTISQVLKWLREEKKIHIVIGIWGRTWGYDILNLPSGISLHWTAYDENINNYEQAVIAGISYVLDNLIKA